MISQEQLFAWCEAHKAEQLALLKELAAIPSPSHHEEKSAEFIKAWLEKAGAKDVDRSRAQRAASVRRLLQALRRLRRAH